jgi:hypothetical protein
MEILAEATGGVVHEPLTQQLYQQRLNFPKKEVLEAENCSDRTERSR